MSTALTTWCLAAIYSSIGSPTLGAAKIGFVAKMAFISSNPAAAASVHSKCSVRRRDDKGAVPFLLIGRQSGLLSDGDGPKGKKAKGKSSEKAADKSAAAKAKVPKAVKPPPRPGTRRNLRSDKKKPDDEEEEVMEDPTRMRMLRKMPTRMRMNSW